jgi:hypothetical protein
MVMEAVSTSETLVSFYKTAPKEWMGFTKTGVQHL